jgi:hypothetical protein
MAADSIRCEMVSTCGGGGGSRKPPPQRPDAAVKVGHRQARAALPGTPLLAAAAAPHLVLGGDHAREVVVQAHALQHAQRRQPVEPRDQRAGNVEVGERRQPLAHAGAGL